MSSDRPATERERAEKMTRQVETLVHVLDEILACETKHDERGHAYLKIPARSLNDLGAAIAFYWKQSADLLSSLPPVRAEGETKDERSNLVDAANAAWRDLDDWRRFAEAQRAAHPDPAHAPNMPTDAAIAETRKIVGWLGRAIAPVEAALLRASAPVRAEKPTEPIVQQLVTALQKARGYVVERLHLGNRYDGPPKPGFVDYDLKLIDDAIAAALPPVQEPPTLEHAHDFAYYEVCTICGRTDAAINGCHHCNDGDSVKNGRCWWCLKPASSPSQGVRLDDLKALLARWRSESKALTENPDTSHGLRLVGISLGVCADALSAALEGANNGKA